jgi:hypothetical protein
MKRREFQALVTKYDDEFNFFFFLSDDEFNFTC